MLYILFLFSGLMAFYVYDKQYHDKSYSFLLLYISPFIALWTFFIGGQLNVGTDYYSYLGIFNGKADLSFYLNKGEVFFYGLVHAFQSWGFEGQFFFYLFALLYVFLYLAIAKNVGHNYTLLFFLFVTVSTMLHSQMNGIRQCTAVYFVTLALLELLQEKKKNFFVYVILATGFHISAISIIFLFFFRNIILTSRLAKVLIIITAILAFIPADEIIKQLIVVVPQYSHYAESDYLQQGVSVSNKLTKLILFPLYYYSVSIIETHKISAKDMRIFQFGLFSYLIKTICIVSSVTYRFGHYFFILSIFPLFYYLIDLQKRNFKLYVLSILYLIALYSLKVIVFPIGEYLYSSVFITYF